MLVAINEDRQILNLLDIDRLKMIDLKTQKFRCPVCKGEVYLKHGSVRAPHFAHVSTASCQYASEHESYQHLSLKKVLYPIIRVLQLRQDQVWVRLKTKFQGR